MTIQTFIGVSLALGLAAPGVAQDSATRSPRMPPAPSAETVLRLRQELSLTDEQVAQLDALRREALATRQAHMAQMMELRSRQLAGELSPEEWRAEIAKQRDEGRERMGTRDDRVAGVLTEAQRERLTSPPARVATTGLDRAWRAPGTRPLRARHGGTTRPRLGLRAGPRAPLGPHAWGRDGPPRGATRRLGHAPVGATPGLRAGSPA